MNNTINVSGHEVTRIGFGCWQMAGSYTSPSGKPNGYGAVNDAESIRAVHKALEHGINFFDTASGYNNGKSEIVLGEALRAWPAQKQAMPMICTKYATRPGTDEDDYSAGNMLVNVDDSLRRLNIEQLGVILLHNPPDDFNYSDLDISQFEKLKETGKILSYGVSCRTMRGVENVLKQGFGSVIEAVYNPLDRRYAASFSNDMYSDYTFICRVPLASGFLSPKTLAGKRTFPGDDIRSVFSDEQTTWVSESVHKLAFLNDLPGGITVSALRFQLSNPYSTLAIPGIKTEKQANDAVMALNLGPLPEDVLSAIDAAVPEVFYKWR